MDEWPAWRFPLGLTAEERELTAKISELSERCYYAGWLHDCEYEIWSMAVNGIPKNRNDPQLAWGHCSPDDLATAVEEIASLARSIDRWVVWDDAIDADMAVRAVDLTRWVEMFGAWEPKGGG